MAILIDPPAWPAHGTLWSHLVSDTSADELHAFARLMGFPRRSFDLDHYDVSAANYDRAVALGAQPVAGREVVRRLQLAGLRVRQVDRERVTPLRRRQYLAEQWTALGAALGTSLSAGVENSSTPPEGAGAARGRAWHEVGEELIARWNEPHRSYHDERHLEDVLLALDHLESRGERIAPETLLAAWFHDAVYAGSAGDDERASAALAVAALTRLGCDRELIDAMAASIIATTPGLAPAEPRPALAQLLDADLWIFAASPSRYAEYAAAVRREYAHVPAAEFAAARTGILAGYLDRPALYATEAARHLWERRARANVSAEIERLREWAQDAPR